LAQSNQLFKKVTFHGVKFEAEVCGISAQEGQTQYRIYTTFSASKTYKNGPC